MVAPVAARAGYYASSDCVIHRVAVMSASADAQLGYHS